MINPQEIHKLQKYYSPIFVITICISFFYVMIQCLATGYNNVNTNFPFRKEMILQFSSLRMRLGDRVFSSGIVGKDGWLFTTQDKYLDNYQNYYGKKEIDTISRVQKKIQLLYEKLRARNITLLILIAPDNATIYPEKMPEQIQKINPTSKLDLLMDVMEKNGPDVMVDVRQALLQTKNNREVYYRIDTHWNANGAFVAYTTVLKRLSIAYPDLSPKKINSIKIINGRTSDHDLVQIMGVNPWPQPFQRIVPINNNVQWVIFNSTDLFPQRSSYTSPGNNHRLLMYFDSFGYLMLPILATHFGTANYIYRTSQSMDAISFKEIEIVKPEIVIFELTERYMFLGNKYDLELQLDNLLAEPK